MMSVSVSVGRLSRNDIRVVAPAAAGLVKRRRAEKQSSRAFPKRTALSGPQAKNFYFVFS